jgi:indolepyruvate ferredoxin oxidoreductase beta subunit
MLVTAAEPFVNIGNYPPLEDVIAAVNGFPLRRVIEAAALAKKAGLAKAVNTVMVGAASPFLPIKAESLENSIAAMFSSKDAPVISANIKAFRLGRQAVQNK